MKNKWIKLSIFFIISLLLFTGCKVQSVDEYNDEKNIESNETKETASSDSPKDSDDKSKAEAEADEEKNEDIKEKDEKVTSSSDNKTDSKDNRETKKKSSDDNKSEQKTNTNTSDKKATDSSDKKTDSNKGSNDKTNSQTKPKPQPEPQPEPEKKPDPKPEPKPSKKYVTIEIRVDTILKNYDKLDPKLKSERFVPKSGVILSNTKYEISGGETVLDVLAKATRQNRIPMEYRGSGSGAYIEGINNIYEFSCGENSGWKYKVNGTYPNHGAGAHKLNAGDSISWNYTCDLGRDL